MKEKEGIKDKKRDFSRLHPPPREVPMSLKLYFIFSNGNLGVWIVAAFSFLCLFLLKEETNYKIIYLLMVLFPLACVFLIFLRVRKALYYIKMFRNGMYAGGKLISKERVLIQMNLKPAYLYKLHFEYEAKGSKYNLTEDSDLSNLLLNDDEEPILYDDNDPLNAILADGFNTEIILDDAGNIKQKYPFRGYFNFLLFLLSLIAAIYLFIDIWG